MTLTHAQVEAALIPRGQRGPSVSLHAGVVTDPRMVDLGDGPLIVDGPTGETGQEGYVLNVDGHRYWLPFSAVDLSGIAARVSSLESTVNTGSNRNSALRSAISSLESTVNTGSNRNSLLRSDLNALMARVAALEVATADTGWQTVTLLSGFTGSLAYRIVGPVVHWAGKVTRTAGAYPATWTQIATIPAVAIPSRTGEYSISGRTPGGAMQCDIYSNGQLRVSGTGTSTEAVFSGLTWL